MDRSAFNQPRSIIMAGNLTHFDPQSPLSRLHSMRGFANPFDIFDLMRPSRMLEEDIIRLDITENDQAYVVKAEIPGMKRDDIKVAIQGDQVTISAEIAADQDRTEGNVVCRERYRGKQFRSFTLPQFVDEENAHASYHDGVLELNLPKKSGTGARQLTIQ
jgi:HSP20 family protein